MLYPVPPYPVKGLGPAIERTKFRPCKAEAERVRKYNLPTRGYGGRSPKATCTKSGIYQETGNCCPFTVFFTFLHLHSFKPLRTSILSPHRDLLLIPLHPLHAGLAMIVTVPLLALAATLLSSPSLVHAISSSEIPSDTPVSVLLASANAHLAKGETNDALTYYDVAISRDPENYLSYFKRGATYLSLGRTVQATSDFDKVLSIKPGFKGALLQRAKIRERNGEWDAAMEDLTLEEDKARVLEAKAAAKLAAAAEGSGDWEECAAQASVAIMTASKNLSLRKIRAHCRFERGLALEGMSDLKHVLQMQPGDIEPHIKIAAITFYALADFEHGMDQLRKCLHGDPDSKPCKKLYRRQKTLEKQLSQVKKRMEKHQYATAVKVLLPSSEDAGLVQDIRDDVKELREAGTIPPQVPDSLISEVVQMVCEAYHEVFLPTLYIFSSLHSN